ncbi:hypothetical protein AALM99_10810 [Lactococcus muris]|uniref:Uncharacterized protein n=1 Tax=Lactococcus muris TaxID=2941330 RepID=A0ABV4DB32_9LACT
MGVKKIGQESRKSIEFSAIVFYKNAILLFFHDCHFLEDEDTDATQNKAHLNHCKQTHKRMKICEFALLQNKDKEAGSKKKQRIINMCLDIFIYKGN